MTLLMLRAIALIVLALLVVAPVAKGQDPPPTVISGQYQPAAAVPGAEAVPVAPAATGGAVAPDVTEIDADNKGDITAVPTTAVTGGVEAPADDAAAAEPPAPPAAPEPPAPPEAPPAPPAVPVVDVDVGAGATNVTVTVRVGSAGRNGDVRQISGGRQAPVMPRIPDPVVVPAVPDAALEAARGNAGGDGADAGPRRSRTTAPARKRRAPARPTHPRRTTTTAAAAAVAETAYVALTTKHSAVPSRTARQSDRRTERATRAAPRRHTARLPAPPPWWTGSSVAAGSGGTSAPGPLAAILAATLLLIGFQLVRGVRTVADGPPAEPPPTRLERPG
jgi:hypothetical protein